MTVVLVGCSKKKLPMRARARHLYQGTLFKKSVEYATLRGLQWAILSTKLGLVMPDDMVEPYSHTLSAGTLALAGEDRSVVKATKSYHEEWAASTRAQLDKAFATGTKFVSLCGKPYEKCLAGLDFSSPLAGLKLFSRVAWLKKANEAARAKHEDLELWTT